MEKSRCPRLLFCVAALLAAGAVRADPADAPPRFRDEVQSDDAQRADRAERVERWREIRRYRSSIYIQMTPEERRQLRIDIRTARREILQRHFPDQPPPPPPPPPR